MTSADEVPNLTWKDSTGAVQVNPLHWVPSDLNAVAHTHPTYGRGRIGGYDHVFYIVYFKGEMRKVPADCRATIGQVSNHEHSLIKIGSLHRLVPVEFMPEAE